MRILYLSAYFSPEHAASDYLSENLYSKFTNEGCEINLFTPTPTREVTKEVRAKYKKIKTEKLYDGKMTVHRFSLYGEGRKPFGRFVRYLICDVKEFFLAILRDKDSDLLFLDSTPPIQGLLGAFVKKCKHIPFVYSLQDIFPDSLVGTGLAKKNGALWKMGRIVENFTYRNADKIIVISEDFKINLMAKGVPEDKIVVVYNWVDEKDVFDIPRSENSLFDRYNLDRSKFYVTYNGNIGLTQNMDMLIEVAEEMEHYKDIQFVLVGNGTYKEQLESIINIHNVKNVTLIPFQPYEDISKVFSLGDVGIVISKPGVGSNSVPSKTWNIMSASRPILANFDENELMTIIDKNHCGIFTKAGDKASFISAILKLYNDRELCKRLGENGRKYIMENLTKDVGTQKYYEVIKSVDKR